MFRYYLMLGWRSLRRSPVLTVLMVLTLAVGVSASMTTLTILHGMSGDPIAHKSDRLFVPQLDNYPADAGSGESGRELALPDQLTYMDAMALWEAAEGLRQTPLYGISPTIDSGRADLPPFFGDGAAVGRDFFAMFDVPFVAGQVWSEADDRDGNSVAVISQSLAERLFGTVEGVTGRSVRLSDREYTVSGVIENWRPLPKFYRVVGSNHFGDHDEVFVPMRTAIAQKLDINGNINCSSDPPEPGFAGQMKSECVWVQYWVELNAASERGAFLDHLGAYVAEQKVLGRFARPPRNRLSNVREWMEIQGVVDDDTQTATWLAFGFLLVCLVNTVGLLLAKFSANPGEIGVRRALGATRGAVFRQYLTEAGVIGLVGAVVGVGMTVLALAFIRRFDTNLEMIARLDASMLATALALSIGASLLAGLLPTWRACQVVPALQLKSQ